jgi:hypothetical protein
MATILFIRQKTTFFSFLISKANVWFIVFYVDYTVFASAKILIRKQFTTISAPPSVCLHCFCLCKDINSKAIHNRLYKRVNSVWTVFASAKILIRKQFTTDYTNELTLFGLFLPLQRY